MEFSKEEKEQLLNQLTRDYNDVFRFLKNFENTVEEIKNTIQETIDQNNASYFEKSLKKIGCHQGVGIDKFFYLK